MRTCNAVCVAQTGDEVPISGFFCVSKLGVGEIIRNPWREWILTEAKHVWVSHGLHAEALACYVDEQRGFGT